MKTRTATYYLLPLLLITLLCSSCEIEPVERVDSHRGGPVTVGFIAGGDAQSTKVSFDLPSSTYCWQAGDQVAVFARNSQGEYTLAAQPFSLMALKSIADGAYFTATLPSAMPQDTYTYYVAYPMPQAVSGTQLTYSIPTEQDGSGNDGTTILVSTPVSYGALAPIDESEPRTQDNTLSVRMRSLLHYFRFYIPQGCNTLGGPVERIEFSMPQSIAGVVSVDCTDMSGSLSSSSASSSITLKLSQNIDEGQSVVAAFMPPSTAYGQSDLMTVTLYSESAYSSVEPIALYGRDFPAGHITPVPLKPNSASPLYGLKFTLASNHLGQQVRKVTLTLTDGSYWPGTTSSVYEYSEPDGSDFVLGETFRAVSTTSQSEFRALSGKSVAVTYESEDAIVSESLTLPSLSSSTVVTQQLHCPYLLFEDFSRIQMTDESNDKDATSSTGSKDAFEFLTNPSWYLARGSVQAGTAVRIASRRETSARYPARMDAPALSGIKAGHTVAVDLSFNYSMSRKEWGLGSAKPGATLFIGSTSGSSNRKSGDDSCDSPVKVYIKETDGSFTNIYHEYNGTISGMTSERHICWRNEVDNVAGLNGSACHIYIDNVRVSIHQ